MEEAFRALLTGAAGVTAITPRIDWGAARQGGVYPLVVLNTVGGENGHTLDGPDGIFDGRVQVDCYGATMGEAVALSRAVHAAVDGHDADGFQGVFHAGRRTGREGGTDEAARPYRVSLDYLVIFNG